MARNTRHVRLRTKYYGVAYVCWSMRSGYALKNMRNKLLYELCNR